MMFQRPKIKKIPTKAGCTEGNHSPAQPLMKGMYNLTTDERKAYMRAYRATHRDELNEYHKLWADNHKDKVSEINRRYEDKKRDVRNTARREYSKRYRARKKADVTEVSE